MFTGRLSHRDQLTGLFKVTEFRAEFRLFQAVCGEEEFQNAGHSHIQNRANSDFMWDTWGSSLPPPSKQTRFQSALGSVDGHGDIHVWYWKGWEHGWVDAETVVGLGSGTGRGWMKWAVLRGRAGAWRKSWRSVRLARGENSLGTCIYSLKSKMRGILVLLHFILSFLHVCTWCVYVCMHVWAFTCVGVHIWMEVDTEWLPWSCTTFQDIETCISHASRAHS